MEGRFMVAKDTGDRFTPNYFERASEAKAYYTQLVSEFDGKVRVRADGKDLSRIEELDPFIAEE